MLALFVDEPEVHEIDVFPVQNIKRSIKIRMLSEIINGVGERNQLEIGRTFFQEEFDYPAVVFHSPLERLRHAFTSGLGIIEIDDPPHHQEREHGTYKGEQDESSIKTGVGLPVNIPGVLLGGGVRVRFLVHSKASSIEWIGSR
jgi:hypothetical protein